MKKLRIGVVGVGHIGSNHARIYAEIPSAEFAAVYDVDLARANSIAKQFGVTAAKSLDEFIELVGAVDSILQVQAQADADYCATTCGRTLSEAERQALHAGVLKAYRWQYILSGAQHPHFVKVLSSLITPSQGQRIQAALATMQ